LKEKKSLPCNATTTTQKTQCFPIELLTTKKKSFKRDEGNKTAYEMTKKKNLNPTIMANEELCDSIQIAPKKLN